MMYKPTIRRLSSGWYHIHGDGCCEWAQVPYWPASEEVIREHAFPEASETFLRAVIALSSRLLPPAGHGTRRLLCDSFGREINPDGTPVVQEDDE